MVTRSGTMRALGLVATVPFAVTRPARISACACARLASPSFERARSSDTPCFLAGPPAAFRARPRPVLTVVAELERDTEILRAQRLHRVLEFVFRRRAHAHLVGLDRR